MSQNIPSANPSNVIAILRNRIAEEVVQRAIAEAAALEAQTELERVRAEIAELRTMLEQLQSDGGDGGS